MNTSTNYSHYIKLNRGNATKLTEACEAAQAGTLFHYFANATLEDEHFQRPHDIYVDWIENELRISLKTRGTTQSRSYRLAHDEHGFDLDAWVFPENYCLPTKYFYSLNGKFNSAALCADNEWGDYCEWEAQEAMEEHEEFIERQSKKSAPRRSFDEMISRGKDIIEPDRHLFTGIA